MFDLGEQKRVVLISVTEGDDKPLKYPDMFQSSQLCIINKIDLLPDLKCDLDKLETSYGTKSKSTTIELIELSCTTGRRTFLNGMPASKKGKASRRNYMLVRNGLHPY
ncbi:MAG: GTP-binding protein [Cytophagales bacterium]|nr:GTP-binding protein [Cytophagales bacterium]